MNKICNTVGRWQGNAQIKGRKQKRNQRDLKEVKGGPKLDSHQITKEMQWCLPPSPT